MRIGVPAYRFDYYTNLRTIVNKLPDVAYVPVRDLYGFLRGAALRVNRVVGKPLIPTFNLNNQFEDFDLNKVDLLHFSNGISYGKIPWISSFETILPRFENLVTRQMSRTTRGARPSRWFWTISPNEAWKPCVAVPASKLLPGPGAPPTSKKTY